MTTIEVALLKDKVVPATRRVEVAEGERVRIVFTSDVGEIVHVHGYDLEKKVAPSATVEIEFTADKSGLFEVETHESGKVLFQLVVR